MRRPILLFLVRACLPEARSSDWYIPKWACRRASIASAGLSPVDAGLMLHPMPNDTHILFHDVRLPHYVENSGLAECLSGDATSRNT